MRPYLVSVDDSSEECFAGVATDGSVMLIELHFFRGFRQANLTDFG